MRELSICFVGIGSIARRHIRNIKKICEQDGINVIIDAVRRNGRRNEAIEDLLRNVYGDVSELCTVYDAVFITNPTELHLETLKRVTPYGKNFFVEKPVASVAQIKELERYQEKQDAVYYVACPLRYNAVIQYIKNNIKTEDIISVRSISSSYLPDWRAGIDYRDTYSAHKDMGGGVAVDLIHEWDYLTYLFGKPTALKSFIGKKSELEIDSEDYAIYLAEYVDKIVELHLDYFGRKTIREVMLLQKDETVIGDIANNKIVFLKSGEVIDFSEERDDFQMRELRHFFALIDGKKENDNDIKHAVDVLKLTQGVLE